MAQTRRRDIPPAPVSEPEQLEVPEGPLRFKSIETVSEPTVVQKHMLQCISDELGQNWRCMCGYVYPRPPMEVITTNTVYDWLMALVAEHEK